MIYKAGDKVRNLINPIFSNGEKVCTIDYFTENNNWAYLVETGKRIRVEEIALASGISYEDEEL